MRLGRLLERVEVLAVHGPADLEVRRVTQRAQEAGPEDAFVAIRGRRHDGHAFVATTRAGVVVVEDPGARGRGTTVVVRSTREALGRMAAAAEGWPAGSFTLVGVTGTNGKTTVAWLLEALARAAGLRAGVIGTTGHRADGKPLPGGYTTPEAPEYQALLARMRDAGCDVVASEVSSIALASGRVEGCRFRAAVLTTLGRDHLDFHGDLQAYHAAKRLLFERYLDEGGVAVLPAGPAASGWVPSHPGPRLTWGTGGDVRAASVVHDLAGSRGRLLTPWGEAAFELPLVGTFNVDNALAAAAAALGLGWPLDAVVGGLAAVPQVPGRLERVPDPAGRIVLVDYAHTPEAIERVLAALRAAGAGPVTLVFGCGGERDRGKRVPMARAAARADRVIATSDNPRGEDPLAILDDLRPGLPPGAVVEPDREAAIRLAVAGARPGEVVLIAGKGHEAWQEVGDRRVPFDDREVAARVLREVPG